METTNISSKGIQSKHQNMLLARSEVVLVFASVVGLMWITELLPGFESWQRANLGKPLFSSILCIALPGVLLFYLHGSGNKKKIFSGDAVKKALTTGGKALLVMFPATFFPHCPTV